MHICIIRGMRAVYKSKMFAKENCNSCGLGCYLPGRGYVRPAIIVDKTPVLLMLNVAHRYSRCTPPTSGLEPVKTWSSVHNLVHSVPWGRPNWLECYYRNLSIFKFDAIITQSNFSQRFDTNYNWTQSSKSDQYSAHHQMETFSVLLALCPGNSLVTD